MTTAAAAVFTVLIAGIAASISQAIRAGRAEREARLDRDRAVAAEQAFTEDRDRVLRAEGAATDERNRAVSAEARTAAVIMAVLPIITGALLSISRPGYLRPLLDTPSGQTMLTVGVVSMVLGIITMRQLIAGATRD